MGLPERKTIYGVHSVTPYNPATGVPLGDTAKVVGNLTMTLTGDNVALNGGSNPFPWAVENGLINTETTLLLREYPNFVYEAFLGAEVTKRVAEASGGVDDPTNRKGTSMVDGTTGIAAIAVKSGEEANVKTGKYVIEAASATTINVYAMSDVDFKNGTDLTYVDETLKINSSPITITDGGAVSIPNTGLEITGGSSVAMVTGDTALVRSRAINSGSQDILIGDANFKLPDVGLICMAQKRGDNAIYEIDLFRCKGSGAPIAFAEQAFSEAEIPLQAFYSNDEGGIARINRVQNNA